MTDHEAVADLWFERVLRTYPPQTAQFLAAEQDEFRNPVGHILRESLRVLIDELCLGMNRERITAALDAIVQVQAVQDLPPGTALAFLFQTKDVLRCQSPAVDLRLFESRVDELALLAFNLYEKYRERTWEIRANEARRRAYVLERRLLPRERAAWQERGDD